MRYVLFVCTHNAGRSQMAQAFFERHAPDDLRAESAGRAPAGAIWPNVVEAMREVGIDLSDRRPRKIDLEMQLHADGRSRSTARTPAPTSPVSSRTGMSSIRQGGRWRRCEGFVTTSRGACFLDTRIEEIRTDRSARSRRLARLLPPLVEEFGGDRSPEEIRACADAVLAQFDDVPVRSFLETLAYRKTRACLREDECALLPV
jgi:hypothetical protein